MTQNDKNTHTRQDRFRQYSFRDLSFFAVLGAIVFGINEGLWLVDKIIIAFVLTALVPIKFLAIVLRTRQIFNRKSALVIIGFFLFILAFLFDFKTIPNLWVYRLGKDTQGLVVESIMLRKEKNNRLVIYDFSVNNVVFRKEQRVKIQTYKNLEPGAVVPVKYLPNNPKFSFLVDEAYLKSETMLTLFAGLSIILALYINIFKEKITSVMQNNFQSKKPA